MKPAPWCSTSVSLGLALALLAWALPAATGAAAEAEDAIIELAITSAGVPLRGVDTRVLVFHPGRPDSLVAEGRAFEPIRVPPGRYDLRAIVLGVKDRPSLQLNAIDADPQRPLRTALEIPIGELSVEAQVGALPSGEAAVVVQLFRAGARDELLATLRAGERVLLGAGRYDLRVIYLDGAREKAVRWIGDVAVRAGLHTPLAVRFTRGHLRVHATNLDTPIAGGRVRVRVFRSGDVMQEPVADAPAGADVDLPVGRYDAEVTFTGSSDRPLRRLQDVEVRDGEVSEHTVRFDSGTLVVEAHWPDGSPLNGFAVFVYAYRRGDHEHPVAYVPAGRPLLLASGRYDVRAHFLRSHDRPDRWLNDIDVTAMEPRRETVVFPSGRLMMRALDGAGEELVGDNVFVHVHAAGEHAGSIATARTGELLVLTAGRYDVRLSDTRSGREQWVQGLVVEGGELTEHTVRFVDP